MEESGLGFVTKAMSLPKPILPENQPDNPWSDCCARKEKQKRKGTRRYHKDIVFLTKYHKIHEGFRVYDQKTMALPKPTLP